MPESYSLQSVSQNQRSNKGLHWGIVVTLSLVTIVYNLVGGAIFQALEEKAEKERFKKALDELNIFLHNVSSCMDREDALRALESLRKSFFNDIHFVNYEPVTRDLWTFFESAFYATTIITSIGYGKQVPKTLAGQWITVLYAIIGIPLYLVTMAAIAAKMMAVTSRLHKSPCNRKNRLYSKVVLTSMYIFIGCLLFLFLPALIFREIQEDWDYSDSLYFCFITITTIGLGDFVPSYQGRWTDPYLVMCILYIYLGLAWLSGIITALATWWSVRYTKAYDKVLKRMETHVNDICQNPNGIASFKRRHVALTSASKKVVPIPE